MMTKDEFITRATTVHGQKYSYEKIDLACRINGKVIVTCPHHGDFLVKPSDHIRARKASGCPKCSRNKLYTNEDVRRRAEEIYGTERFDFSTIDVNNRDERNRVTVICRRHGSFKSTVNNLLKPGRKNCCPQCSSNPRYTTASYIRAALEVHHGRYTYPNLEYKGISEKVRIECPVHGEFLQYAKYHILGHGCPKCNPARKSNTDAFIKKAMVRHASDNFDYSEVVYVNSTTPVKIICKRHGPFYQEPNDHLTGNGCPRCYQSHLERDVKQALISSGIEYIEQANLPGLKKKRPLRVDFFLPKQNTVIECQGRQHFYAVGQFGGQAGLEDNRRRDNIKRDYCKSRGIKLLYFSVRRYGCADVITSLDELLRRIQE